MVVGSLRCLNFLAFLPTDNPHLMLCQRPKCLRFVLLPKDLKMASASLSASDSLSLCLHERLALSQGQESLGGLVVYWVGG